MSAQDAWSALVHQMDQQRVALGTIASEVARIKSDALLKGGSDPQESLDRLMSVAWRFSMAGLTGHLDLKVGV